MTIRNHAGGELGCEHSYVVNIVQTISMRKRIHLRAARASWHAYPVQHTAKGHVPPLTTPSYTRQRPAGQICPFSAGAQGATSTSSTRRAATVVEQVDDAGADAAALAPQHLRWRPAGRADSAAKGRKGQICPFGTKEIPWYPLSVPQRPAPIPQGFRVCSVLSSVP